MTPRYSNSWTKPAIRIAAAGFGVAVAGPLGGAIGGWLGAAVGGPAADLVEKYAEKFGDSAAEKLLDVGADSVVEKLKKSAPNLPSIYRDALRQSLAKVHRKVNHFDDWFANWDLCLAEPIPLNLPATHPGQLVPDKLDDLFFHTLEYLDAQGTAIRRKTLSLNLECRTIPGALLSELNSRLPDELKQDIQDILVKPDSEEAWKQALLIFQSYGGAALSRIDEATQGIKKNTDVLPQMAENVASLLKIAETRHRNVRLNPIPELSEHFFGREEDVKQILERVRDHRVVTVTGLGGIGKSEIVKAVARAANGQDWAADGAFYIDLKAAADATLVKGTIISKLELDPNKQISNQLAGRRLYVLDDLFQALVADRKGVQEFVRALYDSASPSHFLLTSREPVGVPGVENPSPLGRLLPPHDATLFRSVTEAFGYKWQDGDKERLATLLEQLDGYPLAIMIAANRLSDVSLETLLRRWDNRHTEALNLPGISPTELSTMTSVDFSLALSFNHLPEGEVRTLFALFADLPAGATDRALEVMFGDEVYDVLAYLVRGSLLQRQENRWVMLVPVREFASKRRTEASVMFSQKLDTYLIALGEQCCGNSAVWNTSKKLEAMSLLSSEAPNFYAAGCRAKARGDNNFLARLISALWRFLAVSRDSEEMLQDGVEVARAVQQVQLEANCHRALGDVYRMNGQQFASAQRCYDEALRLYQSIGDELGQAGCLEGLGDLLIQVEAEETDAAIRRYEEAALFYRVQGEKLGEANSLRKIGELEEEEQQKLKRYEDAVALFQSIGDELGEANCFRVIGEIRADLNDSSEAQKLLERALLSFRKLEDKPREGDCLMLMGRLHMKAGVAKLECEEARNAFISAKKEFEGARKAFTEMGDQTGQGFCLASFNDIREKIAAYLNAFVDKAACVRWLGDAHAMLNETEEAKQCYMDALSLYRAGAADIEDGEVLCQMRLGGLLSDAKDYSRALVLYEEASKLYARAGDQSKEAEFLYVSGEMQECLEKYEQASSCFEKALGLYSSNSDKLGQAKCLRGLADVRLRRHQNDEAMEKYNEALELYKDTDPSGDLAATYWGIGEAFMERGRRDDAVKSMDNAAELYESTGDTEQAQQARNQAEEWRRDVKK